MWVGQQQQVQFKVTANTRRGATLSQTQQKTCGSECLCNSLVNWSPFKIFGTKCLFGKDIHYLINRLTLKNIHSKCLSVQEGDFSVWISSNSLKKMIKLYFIHIVMCVKYSISITNPLRYIAVYPSRKLKLLLIYVIYFICSVLFPCLQFYCYSSKPLVSGVPNSRTSLQHLPRCFLVPLSAFSRFWLWSNHFWQGPLKLDCTIVKILIPTNTE